MKRTVSFSPVQIAGDERLLVVVTERPLTSSGAYLGLGESQFDLGGALARQEPERRFLERRLAALASGDVR